MVFISAFLIGAIALTAEDNDKMLEKKISIDAEDASLSHVISTMATISGCNIVLATDISEKDKDTQAEKNLTIKLHDVPVEQALALVVKSVGLSYRLIGGNTFLVGLKDRIDEEIGERSYVINLNYTDAEKMVKAISIMPGEAVAVSGQNAILLRANPETFLEISKRIEELDLPQKQIEVRARLIEVQTKEAERIGVDWSKLNSFTTILAEDPGTASGVGLPYNFTDPSGALPYGDLTNYGELPEEQYWMKMNDFDDAFKFSRQLTAFDITVDWLLENNAAKLLTDTRITALNGEEAEIHIGEVVPYVVTDNEYQVQVERENVGIMLKVKPSVNKDGQITVKIEPEVSSVLELVGGYVPRTKVRRVVTTVTVPDGNRIIVGGLLNSTVITTTNRVPFLSSIPFIGKFFTHKVEEVNNTDLIIEVTPRVVKLESFNKDFQIDKRLERKLIRETKGGEDESN